MFLYKQVVLVQVRNMSVNNNVNYQPIKYSYPPNIKGAAKMTEVIAKENYDSQIYNRENQPSYTWPVIGTIVSALTLLTIKFLK